MQQHAERLIELSRDQALPVYIACGTILWGWTLTEQGQVEEGMLQMREGLVAYRATGALVDMPYYLSLQAEAWAKAGQPEKGLAMLAEAQAILGHTGERWYEAELHRLEAVLLSQLAEADVSQVETGFQRALHVSRHQQAKSWELRAAMGLSNLWQQQGKHDEARQLLAPIYHWFTEGLDTADLQEAKALLAAISHRIASS